jgi:hypothetical protein
MPVVLLRFSVSRNRSQAVSTRFSDCPKAHQRFAAIRSTQPQVREPGFLLPVHSSQAKKRRQEDRPLPPPVSISTVFALCL